MKLSGSTLVKEGERGKDKGPHDLVREMQIENQYHVVCIISEA